MNISFLGLGRMGRVLAQHIVDAGHDVTVWNRTPSRADALVAAGARRAATPADAVAGADLVVTAFFGPSAVREAVLDGELPLSDTTVWVDVTTVSPEDATDFASWARSAGVRYVHSPVIGSLAPAANRSLGVLVGGDAADRAVALPIVSLWADPARLWEFDAPSKAAGGKLVANLALAISMQGLVEAIDLGHATGLSTEEVLTTLTGTGLGVIAGMKGQTIRARSFGDTQFSTDLIVKDIGLMLASADRPLPALVTAYAALTTAQDAGNGDDDFSVIAARAAAD
ncbi:hypothetical protein ASE16_13280 [Leifsonia sp. Root227]|uniref:NAD(P)-dependent oxidoreductase n=1 Tax=Leifsonia sp. Root227 TaxID=1736496 RepID=UPI0006FB1199|nr:NAD(P)-dependent oxidoreductase [Leifsonia sp. Root227]KRC49675.1 hypothetical protein ASE16_13280 [Leifsonia sp. Root227]